jgi:2-phosphosulfolactate phosphatase
VKRKLQVCLTPKLFNLYEDKKSIVVIVDVLRATSTMCIAFENGVKRIIPVSKIEEALEYKNCGKDYILAAERNGKPVKGFDFGNSPQSYVNNDIKGKTLVMTTTNGTMAIDIAKKDHEVVVGSFLNLQAIAEWLISRDQDVIIFCAGWKDKFNLEDTIFAGALSELLVKSKLYDNSCDAAQAARFLWESAQGNLFAFLENSSHRKRLSNLNIDSDIHFCLQMNQSNKVPILIGTTLVIEN